MRYLWTIIWAVLITFVLSYVLSSMGGAEFLLVDTLIVAAVFSIAIFILGDGVLRQKKEQ
ncbi:YjzD family protein [Ornithinibacillus halophilus]|uniref:DUF2929 domain-containing protein n=1 Tax=Ornithinibacillus halophilus TaxID=930117 RepID=A0A1M5I3X5_9BACI|nr:YjzD family protein [Ornithinibacillus halophilus]SHG23024.1 Protein of unknown function [Ornithinibacillus halophilus]